MDRSTGFAIRCLRHAALLLLVAGLHQAAAADAVSSQAVDVTGLVERPGSFAVADLERMPSREVTLARDGAASRVYRGVLLRDLLAACALLEKGRFDLRQSYFVARATDGYLAVFSWAEIFNSAIGDEVLVALGVDGRPLPDGEGRIALISGRDLRGGPRHVRWLSSIDVRRVAP